MNDERQQTISMIVDSLATITNGLNKLSNFSNEQISAIKVKVASIEKDIFALQNSSCPRSTSAIVELINIERMKYKELTEKEAPKNKREIMLVIIASISVAISLILMIEKLMT